MPRRKVCKQEIVVIDPTHLTKNGLLILQKYVDHGQRLPTVSTKTSYKNIWKHTKKFDSTRRTITVLASSICSTARKAREIYTIAVFDLPKEELRAFITTQSGLIDDLLDDCEKMAHLCEQFQRDSEGDLAVLQVEVSRLKVATNSKERRDLLLELTRASPIISCIKDVFDQLSNELKAVRRELDILENSSEITLHRIIAGWGNVLASGVQFLH